MWKKLLPVAFLGGLILSSCLKPFDTSALRQAQGSGHRTAQEPPVLPAGPLAPRFKPQTAIRHSSDRYLCSIGQQNSNNAVLKILDMQTQAIRTLFVPGLVQSMAGVHEGQKLYIRSGQPNQSGQNLYEVDVVKGSIRYALSFAQAGIIPTDFLVDGDKIYVAGDQGNQGAVLAYDLGNHGWQPLVYNIRSGGLQWGTTAQNLQVLNFGEEKLTRTTINIPERKVTAVYTFDHSVPFGNNLSVPSPHGAFFYTFHQLQGQLSLYAHNTETGTSSQFVEPEKLEGILFNSVISKNGRFLYASIDNAIQRYEIKGMKLTKLPPVPLDQAEARDLALSNDDRTLYISHDGSHRLTRVRFQADPTVYEVDYLAMPGENHDLVVF